MQRIRSSSTRMRLSISVAMLVLVTLGIAGYQYLAAQFRPTNLLPYLHQPVLVEIDILEPQLYNMYGVNTTTWVDDVYRVTPRYWINDINPRNQVSGTKHPTANDKSLLEPTPLQVSRVNNCNMQPTVSAVGESNVLINVHPQTGMQYVLLYNLKSHVYTQVKGALSGRGNYLSSAYAVITKSGAVMLNRPGKLARLLYRMPMSSAALLKFVNSCDYRTGNMWDYDPANDRLVYSTSDQSVTMVVGGKAKTWEIPGWAGIAIQSLYLEPGTHHVWLCEAMWPICWGLVVYRDNGEPLARSVQGAGVIPWFQPVTQREYKALRQFGRQHSPP